MNYKGKKVYTSEVIFTTIKNLNEQLQRLFNFILMCLQRFSFLIALNFPALINLYFFFLLNRQILLHFHTAFLFILYLKKIFKSTSHFFKNLNYAALVKVLDKNLCPIKIYRKKAGLI